MNESVRVFKFGGASVKDAQSISNVKDILQANSGGPIIVVISAMGKTTNLLEKIAKSFWNKSNNLLSELEQFFVFHNVIIKDLKISNELFIAEIEDVYRALEKRVNQSPSNNFHFEYDQIVSYGELLSTKIVAAYLKEQGLNAMWLDARKVIKTDNSYQEGRVKWEKTKKAYEQEVKPLLGSQTFFISQGFIGQTDEGMTTTLGREGSDFTASIYAYVSNAENVTIWKDVPGMLNADPKYFSGTVLLKKISFTEAVELAYYGASVIHPKTIQPLKNNDIPLYIKSFLNPDNEGTVIQSSTEYDAEVPSYIFKENQVLISVTPKDFSFVVEDQLTAIFSLLTKQHVRINLMQNSAVSFSFLIDNKYKLSQLVKNLSKEFNVQFTEGLKLLTIRHYDDAIIERLTANKTILLTQKTTDTARIILK